MEWKNLANNRTPEIEAVIKEMRTYMPTVNAVEVAGKMRDKFSDGQPVNKKDPDLQLSQNVY